MHRDMSKWCRQVCDRVRFGPDAQKVYKELAAHLEDHYDALVSSGMEEDEAAAKTVTAMGDPDEVGKALDKLHSPVIGWLWVVSVTALVPLVLFALVTVLSAVSDAVDYEQYRTGYNWSCTQTEYEFGARTLLVQPDASTERGGYTICLEDVSLWTWGTGDQSLYLHLTVSRPPWQPQLARYVLPSQLSLTDDRGNQYPLNDVEEYYAPAFFPLTENYIIRVYGFDGAQWLDLSYDRGGYQFTLHADLTGGDGT